MPVLSGVYEGDFMKLVDVIFFIVCAVLVALGVGYYFLIPVIHKKQYQEQRDNLKLREESFKRNLNRQKSEESLAVDSEEGKKTEQQSDVKN